MNNNIETWKVIPGWEHYSISNFGNVRNNLTGQIIKHTLRKGYHGCILYAKGKYKIIRIHALMIRVFTDNWDETLQAAHLDGNKDNNNLYNIKLVTAKENNNHRRLHGTLPIGEMQTNSKLKEIDVIEIKRLLKTKTGKHKDLSNCKIAKMFNVSQTLIWNIDSGIAWKHIT